MLRNVRRQKEKNAMLKWERKLVDIINKKMPLLAFFVIALLTIYMRRAGYWYSSFDLYNHFYPELPTYLHSPFYTLLIRMLPAISVTPVQQVKILVCLFDFIAALGAVQLLREMQTEKDTTALFACFTLLLVSPLTIESGLLWIHMDSLCMSAFLWSLVLYRRKHPALAGILLGAGAAILTQYVILLLLPVLCERRSAQTAFSANVPDRSDKYPHHKMLIFPGAVIITVILFNAVSIGVLGLNLQKGLFMLIDWLIISPETGTVFSGLLPWFKAMPAYFGYMIGTLSLLLAFLKPKYRVPATVLHVLFLLYIGHILQNGW